MLLLPNNRLPVSSERNRGLFSRGARKPNNNGQRKPNVSDGGEDDDKDMSQYPKVESVQETESRLDDIDKSVARMEESSDLKKVTKNAHKSKDAVKDLEDVKQKLSEGTDPMKIGPKSTNLGNDFYYIRKSDARIIVKLDRTTGNLDIVAFALRSNIKNMRTFATVVNSQCDTKIKINPKAY